MLSKIESFYLAILRVVILAVATIALVVAVIAAVSAARSLGHWNETIVAGGDLHDYIESRKATVQAATTADAAATPAAALSYPDPVKEAAGDIYAYLQGQKQPTVTQWEEQIVASAGGDAANLDDYLNSVRAASRQLKISTGKKLTTDQVADYLMWNRQRFNESVTASSVARLQSWSHTLTALYITGGAFFFFILIVFVFIFVKIERSLRLVHTVRMENAHA